MRRRSTVLIVAGLLAACAPEVPATSDDAGGSPLVPTRIGDGPAATTTVPPTTAVSIVGTLPTPTTPDVTARPSVGLGDLPSQVAADLTDPRLFLVGDSVLTQAVGAGQLDAILGPLGWTVVADAQTGRTAGQAVGVVQARRDEIGQVVVVAVGNDGSTDVAGEIQLMLAVLAGVPRVVLLTASAAGLPTAVNDAIRQAALREPSRVALVDWQRVATNAAGVLDPAGSLTPLGAEVLARTIATVLGPAPQPQ
jgi:hypothetical protein